MRVETLIGFIGEVKGKIYCDGLVYKPNRDDMKSISMIEPEHNNLYIYTQKGMNKYVVTIIVQMMGNGTKKRRHVYFDYITPVQSRAIRRAIIKYVHRKNYLAENPTVYSYDVEVRKYKNKTDYVLCPFPKDSYGKEKLIYGSKDETEGVDS